MKLNAAFLVVFTVLLTCQIVEGTRKQQLGRSWYVKDIIWSKFRYYMNKSGPKNTDCTCKTNCDMDNERKDDNGMCCRSQECCMPCNDTLQCTSLNGKCQASCEENENATDTACCDGLKCCEMALCTDDTDCNCKTECDGVIEGEDRGGFCCNNLKCCKPCTGICGGNFTELIGSFASTNYPCNYSNDQDCFYMISVPVGYTVTLTFTTFLLELPSLMEFDFVDIYDGESVNDPLLLHLTGGPFDGTTAQSTANKMLVRFHSDIVDGYPGFNVNYIATITG
ncbi:unnamed protein product [Mytilus coruscus]|uniref:CUB domain-containing protein n=1 Tax=Mytilus coruscus TaxID=42192 RepID=A0A6J8B8G3_MYTCO|nr:unnamed protein product [Mytilus coruscus]